MKWLRNKIIKWVRDDMNKPHDFSEKGIGSPVSKQCYRPEQEPVLSFRIYSAENGKIIEFNRYDRVKDRTHSVSYIVGKEEDIGEKVAKCLKVELLR